MCRVRSPITGRVSYVQFRFTQAGGGSGELELTVTYRVVPPRDILMMMMMMMPKRSIEERSSRQIRKCDTSWGGWKLSVLVQAERSVAVEAGDDVGRRILR